MRHEEVQRVLPWFVNGSIGEKEKRRVLAHLGQCEACRQERDQLQVLQQLVLESDGTEHQNYRSAFVNLMAQIDSTRGSDPGMKEFRRGIGVRATLSFVGVMASVIVAIVFVNFTQPSLESVPGNFRTLSNPVESQGVPHRLSLTFEQPITAAVLRTVLVDTGSNIISGPDEKGSYIVEVVVPQHMTDQEFIKSIRGLDGVKHASFDTVRHHR